MSQQGLLSKTRHAHKFERFHENYMYLRACNFTKPKINIIEIRDRS